MIVYILKIIFCSALFLLVYFLFLEKEKMYRFNRFYLLFSIAFSLAVPFITIHVEKDTPLQKVNDFVLSPVKILPDSYPQQEISTSANSTSHLNIKSVLLWLYYIITAFLLIMFTRNLFKMYSKALGKNIFLTKEAN